MAYEVDSWEVAYKTQLRRNENLTARVDNLKKELVRQKRELETALHNINPTIYGMTREEARFFRTWIIELSIYLRPIFGIENIKYGAQNLAAGFTADGTQELDLDDEEQENLWKVGNLMDKLYTYMDIDDD